MRLIFLTLLCSYLSAGEIYKINSKVVRMKKDSSGIIYSNCSKTCLTAIKSKLQTKQKTPKQKFASSKGSLACKYKLNGKSILGANMSKDSRDFCYIEKYKAIIENNSLTQYLE